MRAAPAVLALALAPVLAPALAPRPAAAQVRVPPAGPDGSARPTWDPLRRLLGKDPRVVVWPSAALVGGGAREQRLDARVTWPAADTAPVALHLVAGIALQGEAYSRSGLRIDGRSNLGRLDLNGAATLTAGFGAGPRRAFSLSLGTGLPAVGLELRTTWFQGAPADSTTGRPDPLLPGFAHPARTGDGRFTDAELYVRRQLGRAALRVTGGQRFGGDDHGTPRWLFAEADLPVWGRLAVVFAGGVRPERTDLAQPGGRFAQLGLRVDVGADARRAPAPPPPAPPAAPAVVRLGPERYRLRLHVPGARRVDLKGDVTDWSVVALHRSAEGDDIWETTFHKPAGIYHVNIRVDEGEWAVPPGLVAVPDRFGGSAGMLNLPATEEAIDEE